MSPIIIFCTLFVEQRRIRSYYNVNALVNIIYTHCPPPPLYVSCMKHTFRWTKKNQITQLKTKRGWSEARTLPYIGRKGGLFWWARTRNFEIECWFLFSNNVEDKKMPIATDKVIWLVCTCYLKQCISWLLKEKILQCTFNVLNINSIHKCSIN